MVILLDMNEKNILTIRSHPSDFKDILENILYTWNQKGVFQYQNITLNDMLYDNVFLKNCIIMFNSDSHIKGFIRLSTHITYTSKTHKNNENIDIFDKIIQLIHKENISVRNLINIGLQQIKARILYKFFLENKLFTIVDKNKNIKRYFQENKDFFTKETIKRVIT